MESFVVALALVALAGSSEPEPEPRRFSYIVSIHRNSPRRNFLCAGSLIASSWVLTTAHCLPKFAYRIRYGNMLTLNAPTYSRILRRIRHMNAKSLYHASDDHRLTPKTNNIGLAMVQEIHDYQVGPLSGVDYYSILGRQVTFFEFGFQPIFKASIYEDIKKRIKPFKSWGEGQHSNSSENEHQWIPLDTKVLRTSEGIAITCQKQLHACPNICVANKCFDFNAVSDPRMALLTPDYGAPLIHDEQIVGVTSEVERFYSRFTPVSPYLTWIQDQMQAVDRSNHGRTKRTF